MGFSKYHFNNIYIHHFILYIYKKTGSYNTIYVIFVIICGYRLFLHFHFLFFIVFFHFLIIYI